MIVEGLIYPVLMTVAMLLLAALGLFLVLKVFFGVDLWDILRTKT